MAQMLYLQNRKDHGHAEQTPVCQGGGGEWDGSLGLVDKNSCLWNG